MKISKVLFTFLIVSIIGLCVYSAQLHHSSKKYSEEIKAKDRLLSRQENLLSDYQVIQLYDWMINFDSLKNIPVNSLSKANETHLYNILNDHKGILFIENGMCEACIQKELLNINKVAKLLGPENIILLTKGYTSRYLRNSTEFKEWQNNIFLVDDWPTLMHENLSGTPNLLIVDKRKKIRGAYHALKSTNKNFEFFISALQQTYDVL